MTVNQYYFPYNAQVQMLPFYVTGIGGSEHQEHIKREEGFLWPQFFYCAEGKGLLLYEDKEVEIDADTYFFLPANQKHEYYALTEKWDVRFLTFNGDGCSKVLNQFELTKPVYFKADGNHRLTDIFNRILFALKTDKIYGEYTSSALIYEYIIEFHCQHINKNFSNGKEKSELLLPALLYIDENFNHDFALTELATQAGITPQHLCRIFNETMKMKPNEYLRQRRMIEAKKLLESTGLSISQIAERTGFSSTGYFCTVFHQTQGCSPVEYRNKYNEVRI